MASGEHSPTLSNLRNDERILEASSRAAQVLRPFIEPKTYRIKPEMSDLYPDIIDALRRSFVLKGLEAEEANLCIGFGANEIIEQQEKIRQQEIAVQCR